MNKHQEALYEICTALDSFSYPDDIIILCAAIKQKVKIAEDIERIRMDNEKRIPRS